MEDIIKLLDRVLNIDFIRAVLSNPRDKEGIIKVKVRPLEKKGNLLFQFEAFTAKQAFHRNLEKEEAKAQFAEYAEQFRQMQIETVSDIYTVLISKKGKITVKRKQRREKAQAADEAVKPAVKRGRPKKDSTDNKTTAKKSTAAKKTADKKTAGRPKKSSEYKKELFVQFNGNQIDEAEIIKRVEADLKEQNVSISDLKLYLKPEDNACYYVANGKVAGKVDLY